VIGQFALRLSETCYTVLVRYSSMVPFLLYTVFLVIRVSYTYVYLHIITACMISIFCDKVHNMFLPSLF